jgi:hypothetical protein
MILGLHNSTPCFGGKYVKNKGSAEKQSSNVQREKAASTTINIPSNTAKKLDPQKIARTKEAQKQAVAARNNSEKEPPPGLSDPQRLEWIKQNRRLPKEPVKFTGWA